jgi:hypothetical protein
MKSLAATILDQRTEVEQYFLESLQEVCALRFVCVKGWVNGNALSYYRLCVVVWVMSSAIHFRPAASQIKSSLNISQPRLKSWMQ